VGPRWRRNCADAADAKSIPGLATAKKLFKLSDFIYKTAVTMGGSISGSAGEWPDPGRHTWAMFTARKMVSLILQIKKIFDPHGIFKPRC